MLGSSWSPMAYSKDTEPPINKIRAITVPVINTNGLQKPRLNGPQDAKTKQETHPLTSFRWHISPTQFWTLPASLMVVVQSQTKHVCPARVVFVHCPCPEQSFVALVQENKELKQDENAVAGC